jgi:hypothetical protein
MRERRGKESNPHPLTLRWPRPSPERDIPMPGVPHRSIRLISSPLASQQDRPIRFSFLTGTDAMEVRVFESLIRAGCRQARPPNTPKFRTSHELRFNARIKPCLNRPPRCHAQDRDTLPAVITWENHHCGLRSPSYVKTTSGPSKRLCDQCASY